MDINQAKDYIFTIARKNQIGYIPIDRLNILFRQAQLDKIETLRQQFELTSIVSDELSPLIKTKEGVLNNSKLYKPDGFIYSVNLETRLYKNPSSCDANDAVD